MNAHVPALVRRGLRGFAHRRLFVRLRVPLRRCASWRRHRSHAGRSAAGRVRLFLRRARGDVSVFSRLHQTPGRIIRLNYAIDMRYGVLSDIATRVHAGTPLDLSMGHVNVIWQATPTSLCSARSIMHRAIESAQRERPQTSVRWLAEQFGQRLGKPPVLTGAEAPDAWLVDTSESIRLFGAPRVPLTRMIDWTADWVARGCRVSARTPISIRAMAPSEPVIEAQLTAAEMPDAEALVREAGWNQVAADWEIFRALGPSTPRAPAGTWSRPRQRCPTDSSRGSAWSWHGRATPPRARHATAEALHRRPR